MTESRPIRVDRDPEGIVTVTIERPQVKNALDWDAMESFASTVRDLTTECDDRAANVRVVIVTGAGREAFCSGGDQRALAGATSHADGARLARLMGDALLELETLPVPVIAAIHGHALGGGAEVALACDLRYVDETVQFGLVHLRLGLIPGWGGGQRLARLVGPSTAMRMLLEARPFGADELHSLRLADRVCPPGGALAEATTFARSVAGADPATVRAVKALVLAARPGAYGDGLQAERSLFVDLWPATAHVEALAAFLGGSGDSRLGRGAG
jgi:enoyl-CoA hydratase